MADKNFSQPIFTKLSLRGFLGLLITHTNLKSDLQNSKWRIQDGKQFQLDGAPAPNLISAKNFVRHLGSTILNFANLTSNS